MPDRTTFTARTLLFAPADDERKASKALRSDADAVILDLEDAVDVSRKAGARAALGQLLDRPRTVPVLVRVNGAETGELQRDLAAVAELAVDGIVLPKATPAALVALPAEVPPVVAIVETAVGLLAAAEIAADERVVALMLGTIDLALDLGLRRRADGLELLHARSALVLASAAAGIGAPLDGVYPRLTDDDGLRAETALIRTLGMGGKACIHPRQLPIVAEVFTDQAEVDWARRVVDAYDRAPGLGVVEVGGEMVDLPVVERARRILAAALDSLSDAATDQGATP
jgi:citrate lyase subunit beta/citryl-CoA lyase